jgi:hypothetical protein
LSSRISESRSCWFMITFMMFVYITRLISVKNALAAVCGTTPLPHALSLSNLLAVASTPQEDPSTVPPNSVIVRASSHSLWGSLGLAGN